jgi:asparagine synthetase B (glutamine-hydrolysing)
MRSSLQALARTPLALSAHGILSAWGREPDPRATVLEDVELDSDDFVEPLPCASLPWARVLEEQVAEIAATASATALALGGGLDAAAVLAAWRRSGAPLPAVMTIETGLGDYDETEGARAIAASFGLKVETVFVPPEHVVELLPEAVETAATPLYNLHPVARFALCRAARERGYQTLITGDGADAAFAGAPDFDYVPVVAALSESTGMKLASPFLDGPALDATLSAGRDPGKTKLREYVREQGLPAWLAARPKCARLMPAIDLGRVLRRGPVRELSERLGIALSLDSDRERVGWVTLDFLVRSLESKT